jgi:hypothetical protein
LEDSKPSGKYRNITNKTLEYITLSKNENPDLQVETVSYPDYYLPPIPNEQRSFGLKPGEERMNYSNYSRTSTRPIYGEYKPQPVKPKPEKIERVFSQPHKTKDLPTK